MTAKNRVTLKAAFETGDTPQGSDFEDLIDSALNIIDSSAQSVQSAVAFTGAVSAASFSSGSTISCNVQSLAGVGTVQGTAAQISSSFVVATNGASDRAYLLPSTVGSIVIFRNSGANTALIFPPSGAQIDALGANNSLSVSSGNKTMVICESATQYSSYAV